MVFCITIMCLGLIGNIMVPIVILKTKDMRNSTNIFLINLSIADLLVLLVCTPTVLVEVNSKPETWILGETMCKLVPFVELLVAHASILTILAISFERYYAICKPLKAGYVCTKTRALSICLLCWVVAGIFTSPILDIASYSREEEYIDGSKVPVCLTSTDSFWTSAFFLSSITIFFIIPLFILIVLYTVIAFHLMSNPSIISKHSSRSNLLKYRKQVIFMLIAVVASFFICMSPFRAFMVWIIVTPAEDLEQFLSSQRNVEIYYCVLYICRCMWYLNTAMNPILYNLMSSKFRDGFIKLLKCKPLMRATSWTERGTRKGTFHTTSTNLSSSTNQNNNVERANLEARNKLKCVTITLSDHQTSNNNNNNNNNNRLSCKRNEGGSSEDIPAETVKFLSEVEIVNDEVEVVVMEEVEDEDDQVDDDKVFYDTLLTLSGRESLV